MVAFEPLDRQDDTLKSIVRCPRNPAQLLCHGLKGLETFPETLRTAKPSIACYLNSFEKQAEGSARCAEVETPQRQH